MKLVSGLAEKLVGQDSAQISLLLFPDSLTYTLQQTGRNVPWQVCAKDAFKHSSGQPIKITQCITVFVGGCHYTQLWCSSSNNFKNNLRSQCLSKSSSLEGLSGKRLWFGALQCQQSVCMVLLVLSSCISVSLLMNLKGLSLFKTHLPSKHLKSTMPKWNPERLGTPVKFTGCDTSVNSPLTDAEAMQEVYTSTTLRLLSTPSPGGASWISRESSSSNVDGDTRSLHWAETGLHVEMKMRKRKARQSREADFIISFFVTNELSCEAFYKKRDAHARANPNYHGWAQCFLTLSASHDCTSSKLYYKFW